ncbi:MAG: hypothetical protein K8R02_02365 [Anaerohalosphaeraceae bacterium]|nr:hypothetical protein [Anaerohalosphaeraceae bacterium]
MKDIKKNLAALITVVLIVLVVIATLRHFRIDNFHTIKANTLYSAGQPRGMDYTRLLYKYHIAAFVNIRSSDEHRDHNWHNEEIMWMRENGANYIELPIGRYGSTPGFPDKTTIAKFIQIMSDSDNLPVLVHGSSGEKRVAMLVGAWMLSSGNYEIENVLKKAKQIKGQSLSDDEIAFLNALAK